MELKQAIDVIEQALEIANAKGAFKLQESAILATAVLTIKNIVAESEKPVEDEKVKELPKSKK